MNECPAPRAVAFFFASSVMAGSVPDQRTRHFPDASQKASPNLMPGTAPTSASWMSSTDLMKCVWPRMKLVSSGLSILTVMSCMLSLLFLSRCFRLRGGYETSRRPRTAPPESPSQPTTGNVAHADLPELHLVLPSAPNVGDHQPTSGTQYPHRFVNCSLPARPSTDVVDSQTGDNQFKAVVCKRQGHHIARVQFDTIRYPLCNGIALSGLG